MAGGGGSCKWLERVLGMLFVDLVKCDGIVVRRLSSAQMMLLVRILRVLVVIQSFKSLHVVKKKR